MLRELRQEVCQANRDLVVIDLDGKVIQGSMHPSSDTPPIPQYLLDKYCLRKHGKDAYYGQQN